MDITTAHILDSLGWAVIHSLWQGALAALGVYLFRAMTRDSQAGLRCGFELIALGLCFAAFIGTFTIKMLSPVSAAPMTTMINDIIIPTATTPVVTNPADVANSLSGQTMTRYMPLLGILWCLGFMLLATRYTVGFAMTHRLRTRGLSPAPTDWQDRFQTLVLNSGIFRKVTLHISDRVKGPMTFGFFKPVVLVPACFFSGLPADQIEAILLHEIAHIRRHDYLINLVQTAIKTILFYHPAIHYICRTVDEDREKACDDFAVNYTQNPTALAKGLATLRLSLTPPEFAMAASNKQKPLLRRLTRLTAPEESRRRRPGQNWGQVATSLAALLVAAGIYTSTNVQFANAHPPETDILRPETNSDVSNQSWTEKKSYEFDTINHDGRDITVKKAPNGSRWVHFSNSWFNIDEDPNILDTVPEAPEAPRMPKTVDFTSYVKFEKSLKQYRVSLDYYIAALKNDKCSECVKTKLHWAKKQKTYINEPNQNFKKDLIWDVAAVPAPPVTVPPAKPQPAAQPIVIPAPSVKPVVKVTELAGAPKYADNNVHKKNEPLSAERWEEETETKIEKLAAKFESKMEDIEDDFETSLRAFEKATEKYSQDPEGKKHYFEKAQKEFADAVLAANQKRATLTTRFDQDVNRIIHDQMQLKQSYKKEETRKAIEKARIDAEKARKDAAQSRKTAEAEWKVEKHVQAQKHEHRSNPLEYGYNGYKEAVLAQLGNDGILPHGSVSANLEYKDGTLYVNGARVSDRHADNYCSLNGAFKVAKTDNMLIEIRPNRLTITNYDNQ